MKTKQTKKATEEDILFMESLRKIQKNPKLLESLPSFHRTVVEALIRDLDKGKTGEG